jgi:hypothetical protein
MSKELQGKPFYPEWHYVERISSEGAAFLAVLPLQPRPRISPVLAVAAFALGDVYPPASTLCENAPELPAAS